MSLMIDTQYVGFVGSRLEGFKQIRSRLWNCRCPMCGDSAKSKKKKRFYIYQNTKDGPKDYLSVACQNCGYGNPFGKFLQEFDSMLYEEYRMEIFKDKGWGTSKAEEDVMPAPVQQVIPRAQIKWLPLPKVSELPFNHPAKQYMMSRCFPTWVYDYFMYSDNFSKDFRLFSDETPTMYLPEDGRIVIPFYDEWGNLQTVQGRAIDPDSGLRYITLKRFPEAKKVFGLDRVNKARLVLVVEGPIDSLFLPNCIATADADLMSAGIGDIMIPDFQYRNSQICKRIEKMIAAGKRVCLFPEGFPHKDINDAVKDGGYTPSELVKLIGQHTYQGLAARTVFSNLRKDVNNDKTHQISSSCSGEHILAKLERLYSKRNL